GKLWTPVAACDAGKSTAIMEKMNLSAPASLWGDRVRLPSSTRTPPRESRISVRPFAVQLNFHGDLEFFVQSRTSGRRIERSLSEKTSVKDVIEACGVPHPEVDLILINDQAVDFDYLITDDVVVEIYPVKSGCTKFKQKCLQLASISRFVLDGHLG